jgi:hypothetical protein
MNTQPCGDPPEGWPSYYSFYARPLQPATRKIADAPAASCFDLQQHSPPTMQVFSPGTWEHTCPTCRRVVVFTVSR